MVIDMADKNRQKRRAALVPRPGVILYCFLLIFSVIFTQLLRNTASAVFFWFLILVPLLSFLLMLIGRACIQVYVSSNTNRCEKMTPVEYEIRIINASPFPLPFAEAVINLPRTDGVRSLHQKLVLSLIPFGMHCIKNTVQFRYRGLYEIGVQEIYLYDYLRMFRIRIDIDNYSNVTVLPRRLALDASAATAASDIPSSLARMQNTQEQSEQANIRDYRMGDTMKSIHWKLSSKAQKLQVRDFNTNDDQHVYIFADFAAPTPVPEVEKARKQKYLQQLLKKRERSPLLPELRLQKLADKAQSLDTAVNQGMQGLKERFHKKRQEAKRRRRLHAGNSTTSVETMDEIDALIRATVRKRVHHKKIDPLKDQKRQAEAEQRAQEQALRQEQIAAEDAVVQKLLEEINGDMTETGSAEMDAAIRAWGGMPRTDLEDEIPELCADAVAEIAIAEIMNEIRHSHHCTAAWFDSREESGIYLGHALDLASFETIYERFAGAPVVPETERVSDLSRIVSESANVTIRIITANLDPSSIAEYCKIPAMFGGAGSGCITEILFYNPKNGYVNPIEREEYIAACAAKLHQQGVLPCQIQLAERQDMQTILTVTQY